MKALITFLAASSKLSIYFKNPSTFRIEPILTLSEGLETLETIDFGAIAESDGEKQSF